MGAATASYLLMLFGESNVPAALWDMVATWGSLYANHPALRTAVSFGHFAGLLAGGGAAIVADLGTLRVARLDAAARLAQLTQLARTHRIVMVSMALITIERPAPAGGPRHLRLVHRVLDQAGAHRPALGERRPVVPGRVARRARRRVCMGLAARIRLAPGALRAPSLAGAALPNIG